MPSIMKKGSMKAKAKLSMKEQGLSASERGRQFYAQKDYESALEAFSEAVECSTEHLLLNALDNRAATLEKLDRLRAALRDARRMIEIMPKFAKGYLRCGKILQLSKHNDLAIQIYERGLKKVKISEDKTADQHRVILQDQHNKLRRAMNPKKTLDPLAYLPLELAVMVCKHLSMRDRVICLAVSRSWRHLLEHTPDLWTTLDTSYVKKGMSMKSLKIHLRRSKYTVDFARITIKAGFDTARMHFLTRCCKELRELRIEGVGMIGESLSEPIEDAKKLQILYVSDKTEVSLGTVQSCTRKCQSIVDMTCLRVKGSGTVLRQGAWPKNEHVKRLELHADKEGRFERRSQLDIIPLMHACPNLTSAILPQWRVMAIVFDLEPWKFLETLDLTNTQITQFPKLPATLKHLTLADNPLLTIRSQEELLALTALPLLETFNCHTTALDAASVMHITSESILQGHLKKLYIGGRMNADDQTPVELEFPSSGTVEELSLACLHLTDRRALQVVGLFPNLRKLDLSNTKITGVAVKGFVGKGITSLKLNECDDISTDAIEWARGKGISVEYKFPSQAAGAQGFAARAAASGS